MKMRAEVVALSAALLVAQFAQGDVAANRGLGLTTCNKYLLTQGVVQRTYVNSWGLPAQGSFSDQVTFEAYHQWFLGYLTGMEVAGLIVIGNTGEGLLLGKLDFYCRANQTQNLAEAAKKVAREFRTH